MSIFRKPQSWAAAIARYFTDTTAGRLLVFLSIPALILVIALWEPTHEPPIFDAQVHYNEESWGRVSIQAILNTAEELNVPWLLVGSMPNEGTWRLYEADPVRVIPMLVPYRSREERETWFESPELQRYIEEQLDHHEYRGIGEFFLFDGQVDTPVVRRVVELAKERHLILHARSDPAALRQLFAMNPYLQILWAHAGMHTPPETIDEMLQQYPSLRLEISHRGDVAPKGELSPQWRELMLRHPSRILLGTGTYTTAYWYQFRYILGRYRDWLQSLPIDVAEQIAYRNGLDLFGMRYEPRGDARGYEPPRRPR